MLNQLKVIIIGFAMH